MFKQILLPVDGSPTAEAAIPYALGLARQFDSEITFVMVVEPVRIMFHDLPVDSAGLIEEMREATHNQARDYLVRQKGELRQQGFRAHYEIREGYDVADALLSLLESGRYDVVVMSTHGRSGVQRWVFGSVAERMVRYADRPVLLVRPDMQQVRNAADG